MKRPDSDLHTKNSQLFILRLWVNQDDQDKRCWMYGKIQLVPDGSNLYFRNWGVLINFLEEQITARGEEDKPNFPLDNQAEK
jgi:hypothetical protein